MITFKLVNVLYVWCVELDGTTALAHTFSQTTARPSQSKIQDRPKRESHHHKPSSNTAPNIDPNINYPPDCHHHNHLFITTTTTTTAICTTRSTVLVHVQDVPCVHIWARWWGAGHRHSHGHEQAVLQEGFYNLTHSSSSLHVRKHTHTRIHTHTLTLLLRQAYTQTMQNTQVNTLTHT
jgi:hypothetical protein